MPNRQARAERQELRVPVSFWTFGQKSLPHTGYTTDVSATGVFVATDSPLAPGTVILIGIEDRERQLVVSGVVARVVKALAASHRAKQSGMGIHFQNRDHAAVRRLSEMACVGCEMDRISRIAATHGLRVIEDAAQGVAASYRGRALGSIGDLGAYSFHETKNYISGEGGALCINDSALIERAEIIRDKGTDRQRFARGEVDKYTWIDLGSSYVPSEIVTAFLYGQLEMLDQIAERRRLIFSRYREGLAPLAEEGLCCLPRIPEECQSNFHMFYVLLPDRDTRDGLIAHLKDHGIHAVFHYVPLHSSPMGRKLGYARGQLPVTDELSVRLVRLPFFYEIEETEQQEVVKQVARFLRAGRGMVR